MHSFLCLGFLPGIYFCVGRPKLFPIFCLASNCLFQRHQNLQMCCKTPLFCALFLANVLLATAAYELSRSEHQKVLRQCQLFSHLDLQMCFSPQPRAFFRPCNFKMCFAPQRRVIFRMCMQSVLR